MDGIIYDLSFFLLKSLLTFHDRKAFVEAKYYKICAIKSVTSKFESSQFYSRQGSNTDEYWTILH